MPNTGERREIKRFANAKEDRTVQDAIKLASKTKQRAAKTSKERLTREARNGASNGVKKVPENKAPLTDQQAANRMVDEGNPNVRQ